MRRLTARSGSCQVGGVVRGVRAGKNIRASTTMDVVVTAAKNVVLQTSVKLSMTHFIKRVVKSVG